jgi:vancomycin resistance protein YoaR
MLDRLRQLARRSRQGLRPEDEDAAALYLALALFAGAAGLIGYLFVPDAQAHAHASVQPQVQLEGKPVAARDDFRAHARAAARAYLRETIKLRVGPWQFESSRAALGVRVDLEALEGLLRAAHDQRSPLRRLHLQERGDLPLALEVPARLEGEQAAQWLLGIKDQVFQRARDARVDLRSGKLLPEQPGFALDVHGTLDALQSALLHGEKQLAARVLKSSVTRTRAALEKLDFSALLGRFESRYNGLDQDRTFNLRVAARHVDGVVLMPGEVFDFNRLVGERSEANGFRPAPVIADGELTDGVGGGTCQIAGTLHAAVFFSGMPFLERYPHTRPSAYLKLGLDATVSYPKLNFKFRNDSRYPVAVGVEVADGRVRAELRGPKQAQREVSFVRRIDKITPYREETRDDASLPAGVKRLAQRGVAGFEVTSFRLIREPGSERLVRERRRDAYPPTTQIWHVGRGPAPKPGYQPPAGDSHGEYRADEYLVLSMGPSTQGVQELERREGRSGAGGWTAREGMPQAP